ncbi:hypothetical protein SY88_13815 [Clostridiales bacterium PH28_bin88]|nr:hypothetical protein SY88_13815 [Clostridiales bacterium PH28_bin88]
MGQNSQWQQRIANRKNFILFFCGAFLVFINFYTSMTVLPLYVIELGGTEFDTGLQTTLFYLAAILMRFYFGPLTDRKGRKLPLTIGTLVFATAPILFLISSSMWALTLARVFQAIGLAAFFSSGGSLVADMAPPARLGTYMGVYRLTFNMALISGPAAALLVLKIRSFSFLFVASFFIGLVALGLLALLKPPAFSKSEEMSSANRFLTVFRERALWPIFFGIALTSAGYGALLTFAVLYISKVTQAANPGIYFTYFSIAGIFATLAAGYLSDRFGRPVVVWPAVMLLGIGGALLFYLPRAPVIFILSSVMAGSGFSGGIAALSAWLVDATDKRIRGTVLAMQESTIDFAIGLSSFVFGAAAGWIGMPVSYLVMGLIVFCAALALLIRNLLTQKTSDSIEQIRR